MTQKQNLVTKADLKKLSTKADFKKLEKKLGGAIEQNRKEVLAFKWEIDQKFQDHREETKQLITVFKDEIISHIDPIMKELQTGREEQTIMGRQLDDHEKRITYLETA